MSGSLAAVASIQISAAGFLNNVVSGVFGNVINLRSQGAAAVTDPTQLRAMMRTAFGTQPPPVVDVTSYMSRALPLAIPAASSFLSPIMPALGCQHVAAAIQMTQGGSVVLNRYLDHWASYW
jgi:hypothetical protein